MRKRERLRFDDALLALLSLHVADAQLVQQVVDEALFWLDEIALRLFLQPGDELDHLGSGRKIWRRRRAGARVGDVAKMHSGGRCLGAGVGPLRGPGIGGLPRTKREL